MSRAELDALRAELAQFKLLCNSVPAAIAYYERGNFTCRYANTAYAQLFGYSDDGVVGLDVAQIIGTAAAARIQPEIDRVVSSRCVARYERKLIDAAGDERHIDVQLLPRLGDDGEAAGAYVLVTDITRHRRAEAALRESEERLAKFMRASAEGIVFHQGGVITDVNPPLLAMLGYELAELRGRSVFDFVAPEQRARVAEVFKAGLEIGYETAALAKDGSTVPVEIIVRTMLYEGERLRMTIVRDIRDRLEAQARIRHLAAHDALTGLPNRSAFGERAQALLAQARDCGEALALLFIDLDHFKRVNDSLGHAAGDELLQTLAQRIGAILRSSDASRGADLVARFGGDEFVLLLAGNPGRAAVEEVAAKLLAAVGEPIEVQGVSIAVTPTIGVAMFPADGDSPEALIKHADTAMYHAKHQGRAQCRFFEPAMAEAAFAELALESCLVQAVREHEFLLHYQPQFALDGRLVGVEALLRWQHPERGLVEPAAFLPLAESRRLVLPIGQWALQQALHAAARWPLRVPVAVNVAALQFRTPGFMAAVQAALAAAPGAALELEITEAMLMDDDHAAALLRALRAAGVRIAIDDFGSGYSSVAHLRRLPIDRVKVPVPPLDADRGAAGMAAAFVQLGRSLQLPVLAEGVETAAQREWAAAQGCDAVQGFLLARPMDEAALSRWLSAHLVS